MGLSQMIAGHDLIPIMDTAVDLDHQPQTIAGEIRDISINRMLATELVAVDPSAPQQRPYALLGKAGLLSKRAGEDSAFHSYGRRPSPFRAANRLRLLGAQALSHRERA